MNNQIKEIIVKGFNELEKHYKFKIKDEKGLMQYFIEDLTIFENEEDIENIKDSIKESEEILKIYEEKLKECYKVLSYFKED